MGDVKGFRFTIGELEAMRAMVNWNVEENARRQHVLSDVVAEQPARGRKRGRNRRGN
jgi:hypothetical protein